MPDQNDDLTYINNDYAGGPLPEEDQDTQVGSKNMGLDAGRLVLDTQPEVDLEEEAREAKRREQRRKK